MRIRLTALLPFVLLAVSLAAAAPPAVRAHVGGADSERVSFATGEAEIPAFARKYRVSCTLCHQPFPRLTEFGETFAGNGFQFSVEEEPRDTIDTGDPMLRLLSDVPFAIRYDGFGQAISDPDGDRTSNDLGFPWGVKLLTGGNLAPKVSWYLYFFLSERGEVAGLEDAYVQFTDIGGSGVSLLVGQFQVSDPLFKRELRLEFEDYTAYRVRVGDARADLTYDRGLMALWSPWDGGDLALGVVNGQGLDEARDVRQFDRDAAKNVYARYSHSFGPIRLGAFGFFGAEEAEDVWNETWIVGPDLSFSPAPEWEVNAQYLYRSDDRPFFGLDGAPTDTEVHAVLAEALWWPAGRSGRWTLSALYNLADVDDEIFTVRVGEGTAEDPFISTYSFGALGTSWLFWRNLRLTGELGWDFESDYARVTAGFVGAF